MSVAVTFRTSQPKTSVDQATQVVWGSLTLSGTYTAVTGDTINFTGSKSPVLSNKVPVIVNITELPTATSAPSGCNLYYMNGTNAATGALRITTQSGASAELSTGSYPSYLTGASLIFEAYFPLGQ